MEDTQGRKLMEPKEAQKKLSQLISNVETVIKGKRQVIEVSVATLLARGHLLIEDVPGVGKTMLGSSLAKSISASFHRVQFTSDLLPSDILGVNVFNQQASSFEFKPGPIFSNIVLADEINRTTPKTQSALLEAMSDNQVSIDSKTFALPDPFMVIATQNPVEYHGTFPLPESQMDRFHLQIRIGYPDMDREKEILRSQVLTHPIESLRQVITIADVRAMQEMVKRVTLDDSLLDYIMKIVKATRDSHVFSLGISPRGSLIFFRACQARALIDGRTYATPDDVKAMAVPALAHRVCTVSRYGSENERREAAENEIIRILDRTPVPL